jgi:hypothetical protein
MVGRSIRSRPLPALPASILLALLCASGSHAQVVRAIQPAQFTAARNERVSLRLIAGAYDDQGAFETSPAEWPRRVEWFFVRLGGTQENREELTADDEAGLTLGIDLRDDGVAQIGVDLTPAIVEVKAQGLARFVAERIAVEPRDRLDPADLPQDRPIRLRRVESAKTLVQVGGGPDARAGSSTGLAKSGQRSEFRPLIDPCSAQAPTDLAFRIYMGGEAREGVRVIATHATTGASVESVTDRDGICRVHCDSPGAWRLEAHAVRRLAPDAESAEAPDFELLTATLTFAINPAEGDE